MPDADSKAFVPPRLTLRVGITGHRPDRLGGADTGAIRERIGELLAHVRAIADDLHAEEARCGDRRCFDDGEPRLGLVTAIAEGADTLAAEVAIDVDWGLNLILPFPRERYREDFAEGAARETFERLLAHERVRSCTELDIGHEAEVAGGGGDAVAYQRAGFLMLAHADLLIAVWDRDTRAIKTGGTADVVREAQHRRMPIVLVTLNGGLEICTPRAVGEDADAAGDWRPLDLAASTLRDQLAAMLRPPADTEARASFDRFRGSEIREDSRAVGYVWLRWLLAGKIFAVRAAYRLGERRKHLWRRTFAEAERLDGAYAAALRWSLFERWLRADNVATHYSHRFRTAYVVNFLLAALSVLVGLLAVIWWDDLDLKALAITAELGLIGFLLGHTRIGRRSHWRRRWLDARTLAEILRPTRLPYLVGSAPGFVEVGPSASAEQAWIAWYVQAGLREIDPPSAVVGDEALCCAIEIAVEEEVCGQIDYNRGNAEALHKLDHNLHRWGEGLLWATVASGAIYLLLWGIYLVYGWKGPAYDFKPVATILGGALPAFGAAMFGIRATGDFRSFANQSERTKMQLEALRRSLLAARDRPTRPLVRRLFVETARTMADDLVVWRMVFSERELVAGPH